jgi:predicted permease
MPTTLSQTFRSLAKSPAFFFTSTLLIALGIAASTTAFTLVNTLFYKPRAGLADSGALANVHRVAAAAGPSVGSWSYPDYQVIAAESRQFSSLSAFTGLETGFSNGNRSQRVLTQLVSANFFQTLGTRPALGRFFLPPEEKEIGTHPVVVISDRLWREQLAADPAAVGRTIKINGEVLTVIGVAEPGFHGTFIGFDFDVWLPLGMARVTGMEGDLVRPDSDWLELIGHLAPGTTHAAAQAEIDRIAQRLFLPRSEMERNSRAQVLPNRPIDDDIRGSALGFVGALSIIAGLVLVIACLNVSSLLLTRAEERRRENAVRLAIGCSRVRLTGDWLRETLTIFACGGGVGLLLTRWIADLSLFRQPDTIFGLSFEFELDARVFGFCFAAALVTGLLTGLAPALRAARADLVNDLKAGGGHGATGSSRLRHSLVVAQLAFSIVPLVVTGLFLRTVERNAALSPGFAPGGLYVSELNLSLLGGDTAKRGAETVRRLLVRARSFPGVTSAVLASRMPLGQGSMRTMVQVDAPATPPPITGGFMQGLTFAGAGYFSTLHIPLISGREFTAADEQPDALPVAIINETTARQLFGARDPLNRELKRGKSIVRVVGVARDVKYSKPWEDPLPQLYLPFEAGLRSRLRLVVQLSGGDPAGRPRARQAVEPELPLTPLHSAGEIIQFTLFTQKLGAQLAAALGATCLLLAGLGLYSVLCLGAARQAREFGIRLALGAQQSQIASLLFRRVVLLTSNGLLLGGALAYGVSTVLQSFLHGVSAFDPPSYAVAAGVLVLAALLAAWLPARRAIRIDPIVALRTD